jgi:uncharacterized protein (UPF0333 family)
MKLHVRSVRVKLLLLVLPLVAAAVIALTTLAIIKSTSAVKTDAYASAANSAQAGANGFNATAEHYMAMRSEIATLAQGDRSADRATLDDMLHSNLVAHPEILGDYVTYQPNAFDGRDSRYRHAGGCCDSSGRFVPRTGSRAPLPNSSGSSPSSR